MVVTLRDLVQQKLERFEQLLPEFEESFQFVQDVHGQKRFAAFPVVYTVFYLHSLWVCDCKGRLLSVAKTIKEYEGAYCLELLRRWQEEGDTAGVVAFLQQKLDTLPFADITRQLYEARRLPKGDSLAERLEHGRLVLLNRGINLMQALDAIFVLSESQLLDEVKNACVRYRHLPDQITRQLEEMDSPLYMFIPHQALAQRNIAVMNELGRRVTSAPADRPGRRTWRVVAPEAPLSPYAEQVIKGYQEMISPIYNNLLAPRFFDLPERCQTTPRQLRKAPVYAGVQRQTGGSDRV